MSDDKRLPYAAMRSEGQSACVIGPNYEILVECVHGSPEEQLQLAAAIAHMLNDRNENHCCSDASRRDQAQHLLLLVRENRIGDNETLETLANVINEAGVKFARAEIAELTGANLPF